jgi:putative DNA primase/helicase
MTTVKQRRSAGQENNTEPANEDYFNAQDAKAAEAAARVAQEDAADSVPATAPAVVPSAPAPKTPTPADTAEKTRGKARPPSQGRGLGLEEVEPAADPVDGQALFAEIQATITRYMALPEGAAVIVSLWVALTYLTEVVDVLPRLLLASPTRECGKTRLLGIIGALVQRALTSSSTTPATLFRAIEAERPTLLLDEMDNARLKENDELRAILNSGHSRTSAWVMRAEGDHHEVRRFNTFASVAFACIGWLPDTVTSRCVRVAMRRKTPREQVERLRESQIGAQLKPLRSQLARWALDHAQEIESADPKVPEGLGDREADNWGPLLAIADAIGAEWPARARQAARTASGGIAVDETLGVELLTDLHHVFGDADRLTTDEALRHLKEMEDRPWAEYGSDGRHGGRGLTARGLSELLKPFGISPGSIRLPGGDKTLKGYQRESFTEAWERYATPSGGPHPAHPAQGNKHAAEALLCNPAHSGPVPDANKASDPLPMPFVPGVPDTDPPHGPGAVLPDLWLCPHCGGEVVAHSVATGETFHVCRGCGQDLTERRDSDASDAATTEARP